MSIRRRGRIGIVIGLSLMGSALLAPSAEAKCSSPFPLQTGFFVVCPPAGAAQVFQVPSGVSRVLVRAVGASGGSGGTDGNGGDATSLLNAGRGGRGASLTAGGVAGGPAASSGVFGLGGRGAPTTGDEPPVRGGGGGGVDAKKRRVRFSHRIPARQARLGTGILTLAYPGDANTQPQEVRLRAASGRARLRAGRPRITAGRLKARGAISSRARGVVRLQLLYEPPLEQTRTLRFTAPIRDGRYAFDERLPSDVVDGIAQRRGVVHSYTLFTGYLPRRIRGELRSLQVLGSRSP